MTSEIDKLKHFYVEDYSGIYFTDELNAGEEFLYTTIGIKDEKSKRYIKKQNNKPLIIVLLIIYLNVENNGKYL